MPALLKQTSSKTELDVIIEKSFDDGDEMTVKNSFERLSLSKQSMNLASADFSFELAAAEKTGPLV